MLSKAKEEAYKMGFYEGKMVYGEFTGKTVQEAKPKVRQLLIESGLAFPYSEPDGVVVSRSGDTCVAALMPQWFLTYGEGVSSLIKRRLDLVDDSQGSRLERCGPRAHQLRQVQLVQRGDAACN
jgi:leucyl-tRNA synthetase